MPGTPHPRAPKEGPSQKLKRQTNAPLRVETDSALELIASGAPLDRCLESLVSAVEAALPDSLGSVVLLDPTGHRIERSVGPQLPQSYNALLLGVEIGPNAGSCGTAAFRGELVVVADIATDPLWAGIKEGALNHGLRACWSQPVRYSDGRVAGTFAIYHLSPRSPGPEEITAVEKAAHVGGIALERDLHERARLTAEMALRESESRYRQMFENSLAIKLLIDPESGEIVDANPAASAFYGYPLDELRHMSLARINLLPPRELMARLKETARKEHAYFQFRHRLSSGEVREVEVYTAPARFAGQTLLYSIIHDVSERRRLEEQLLQAQKMDAIGRLAGGVAHDFNNLLTSILGYAELAEDIATDPTLAQFIRNITKAANRAAALTSQLLTFARRQAVELRVLDLNALIVEALEILRPLLGPNVEVVLDLEPSGCPVRVDPAQFEQVIINLVVNARDAMPVGGQITIRTVRTRVGRLAPPSAAGLPEGLYARLDVKDSGLGVSEEIRARLFEPFFTTKEQGKGTGLGLATCYGIVAQSGGRISAESPEEGGAEFIVHLPLIVGAPPEPARSPEVVGSLTGSETILVVEDEPMVRAIVVSALKRMGYSVVEASDGEEALRKARESDCRFDLLLSDVVMPRMGGHDLAASLLGDRPGLPILLMTGYADQVAFDDRLLDRVIHKPFMPDHLLRRVREALDAAPDSRRGQA